LFEHEENGSSIATDLYNISRNH